MNLILLASVSLAISSAHAAYYDASSTTSLRGGLDFLTSPSNLNRISCKWSSGSGYDRRNIVGTCANRPDDKSYPYKCEDGRYICCDESYMNEPNLDNFGKCTRVPGGPPAPRRPTPAPRRPPTPRPNRPPTPRRPTQPNEIHCIAPNQKLFERSSRRAVCARQTGHNNVPYSCDEGTELCCTPSSMTKVTFNKFGYCEKVQLDEDVREEEEEDSVNFLDEGAQVKCYGPPGNRPCPAGRLPYTCSDGDEMCCEWSDLGNVKTRIRNRRQRLKDNIDLPGHGLCTRDDIPTADSEDQMMISQA